MVWFGVGRLVVGAVWIQNQLIQLVVKRFYEGLKFLKLYEVSLVFRVRVFGVGIRIQPYRFLSTAN